MLFKNTVTILNVHPDARNLDYRLKLSRWSRLWYVQVHYVSHNVENIGYFKWQNIPVISQDAELELISDFEVKIDLKAKRSVHSSVGIMFHEYGILA